MDIVREPVPTVYSVLLMTSVRRCHVPCAPSRDQPQQTFVHSLNAYTTPPTSNSVVASRALPSLIADTFTASGLVAVAVRAVGVPARISGLCNQGPWKANTWWLPLWMDGTYLPGTSSYRTGSVHHSRDYCSYSCASRTRPHSQLWNSSLCHCSHTLR